LERINAVEPAPDEEIILNVAHPRLRRLPFGQLLEAGLLVPGQSLFFRRERALQARVRLDGRLVMDGREGSIHQLGSLLMNGSPCNGWEHWFFEGEDGALHPLDELRRKMLAGE
jgi:modification methylase